MFMGFAELFFIAVGLSMDAFAVSVCKGLVMPRFNARQALVIALFFGGFQALMPVLGWLAGAQFTRYVSSYAHWIAFALLAFIGAKMLWDARHDESDDSGSFTIDLKELVLLAIATSIDALAVGVSFAFLDVSIAPSAALIGVVTFALSFAGVGIGHRFGARWEKPAAIVGGVVLIAIGVKVLLEGLGIIP